jgi:hypothetical protein
VGELITGSGSGTRTSLEVTNPDIRFLGRAGNSEEAGTRRVAIRNAARSRIYTAPDKMLM